MPYKSLSEFITLLEKENELIRIKEFVNPVLEITEITDRFSKLPGGGKALLFENTGTEFPLLINAFGSEKRMCLALGVSSLDETAGEINSLLNKISLQATNIFNKLMTLPVLVRLASYLPHKISQRNAVCQEVVCKQPDLGLFPILKCWPFDGGRFITLPMVITKNPENGVRNVGMYRMQVFSKNTTGMHWHRHKTGAHHYELYKKRQEKMPIVVALGGDPVYTYAATAPLPDNIDEFVFAGFLRKKSVKLVKALTQDIEVPADADIIVEGYIDPMEDLALEGPFGDHTGYYSLADYYPVFHITCITHRKGAIYPATIVGIPPMEDAWIAKATERIFLPLIKTSILPEIKNMIMPPEGVAHNLVILEIEKTYPGQAIKVANALWGAGQMMFNKFMLITDETIPSDNDYEKWIIKISKNINPSFDIYYSQGPMDVLDHTSMAYTFGGKVCIDATNKLPEERHFSSGKIPENIQESLIKSILREAFPKINEIEISLCRIGIPAILLTVNNESIFTIESFSQKITSLPDLNFIKFIIILSHEIDIKDFRQIVWIIGNNCDPVRDTCVIKRQINGQSLDDSILLIDGTRKDKLFKEQNRLWPNILVSNMETIASVDAKWENLNLGPYLDSPSSRYSRLKISDSAIIS